MKKYKIHSSCHPSQIPTISSPLPRMACCLIKKVTFIFENTYIPHLLYLKTTPFRI